MASRSDTKIIEEAKKRFRICVDWEAPARRNQKADVKFAEGDAHNGWQWDATYLENRDRSASPSLTNNKVRQHNLQIINDARQNKPQIRIQPVSEGASQGAAKVWEGIARHIEYISDAQTAYDTATYHQVTGGMGYLRLVTEYVDADSFDLEIYIRRVSDPFSVYLDPDIQQYDGSDASFCFVFKNMKRDAFNAKYPRWKDKIGSTVGLSATAPDDDWIDDDNIRVCEYFRRSEVADTLYEMPPMLHPAMPQGGTVRKSDMTPDLVEELDRRGARSRPITEPKIEIFKIAGDEIIERGTWPGSYIPIARVVGEETVIDGRLDRKGHTRCLIDPQRMYNFWTSAATEHVALQTKVPWLMPMETAEEFGTLYEASNIENRVWLPYKTRDEDNNELPPPHKPEPPVMAQAYMQGMQVAAQEMMMVSGQYQAEMGAPSNERSGKAINERQRQSDNATYHYVDHLAQAVRYLGRMIIDLAPKVYDTERILRILAEDGSEMHVKLDPRAPKAMDGDLDEPDSDDIKAIFNPNVGRYDVIADIGPAYATKRQEAFNMFSQIMQANPEAFKIAGDLMFRASDAPMADELADRLKRALPPQLQDDAPDPMVMQLQQQLQAQHNAAQQAIGQAGQENAKLQQQLAQAQLRLTDQSRKASRDDFEVVLRQQQEAFDRRMDEYKAETARMAAVGAIDPDALRPVVRELVSQALGTPIMDVMDKHAARDQARQPMPEPATEAMQ